jgi:transcriptional regulator with XRE-family HTH domain
MNWKTRIRTLLDSGLSIDDVAAGMGVTPNAVREIMAGRTKAPRAEAAIRLLEMRPAEAGREAGKGSLKNAA